MPQSQRQGCVNGKIEIPALAATDSPPGRMPSGQRFPALPILLATTPAKTCRVFPPVCHFELNLANAMAAGGMMFE
jgi:hypothetical protein